VLNSRWSEHYELGNTPVHMVLSPSADETRHSRLVWWRGYDPLGPQWGGYVDWTPVTDTAYVSWPAANFTFSSTSASYGPGTFDVFCAGHTHVAAGGGKILVSGGTSTLDGEVGMTHNLLLDPATMTWDSTSVANMQGRRWYPTNTQLGSDKVVVASGSSFFHDVIFGGVRGTESDPTDRRIRLARETSVGGLEDSTKSPTPPTSTTAWPSEREGSTVVDATSGAFAYFGGRTGASSYSNQVWYLFPNVSVGGDDFPYEWAQRTPSSSGPVARSEATFAIVAKDRFVAWGGRNASGPITSTDAYLHRPGSVSGTYEWVTLSPSGTAPSARHGHFSIGSSKDSTFYVYGGATDTSGTVTTDTAVHALTVSNSLLSSPSAAWSTITTTGTAPPLAAGGAVMYDTEGHGEAGDTTADSASARLIFFGGRDASGNYSDKIWILRLRPSGAQWLSITPTDANIGRARFGAVYNKSIQRLYIFGGERNDTTLADVRWIDVSKPTSSTARGWHTIEPLSMPTAGLTVVENTNVNYAKQPELYSPSGTQWTTLSPHIQEWFPFGFTIPSALAGGNGTRVFYPGPADTSYWLNPNSSTSSWTNGPSRVGFKGGSAVMYRIGKILKSGTRDTEKFATAVTTTSLLDLTSGSSPAWTTSTAGMSVGRVNHNLVLLPTGDVFCTGGTGKANNEVDENPRTTPEIFDVATSTWYGGKIGSSADTLDLDHHYRGYHSNAMLLPDGRILCGGGNATNVPGHHHDRSDFNIFTPPYLFSATNTLATRPVLTQWDHKTDLGQWTPLQTNVAVDEVVLLRPGASTHGFNQEQRYLPLDVATSGVQWARIPADPDSLPPGDYLMFALKAKVPAIAQWIRISNVADPRPEKITDLTTACPLASDFRVTWTAPHEDSADAASGRCHDYELYVRDGTAVDVTNLSTSILLSTDFPRIPGTEEAATISSLTTIIAGHRYYFRIRSKDAKSPGGQYSAWGHSVSMLASEEVDCSGELSGGGSGGGGYRSQQTFARVGTGAAAERGNSLLNGVPQGEVRTDIMRLDVAPALSGSLRRAWVRQGGAQSGARLHDLHLIAVDHAEGTEALVAGARFLTGERIGAVRLLKRTADGASLVLAPDARVTCGAGEELEVELPGTAAGGAPTLLLVGHSAWADASPDSAGFLVSSASADDQWTVVGHYGARNSDAPLTIEGLAGNRVRLHALGTQTFDFIGAVASSGQAPQVARLTATTAAHSMTGDVLPLLTPDSVGVDLMVGESVTAAFEEPSLEPGQVRTWFLEVTGSHEAAAGSAGATHSVTAEETRRLEFAMGQNRPNPFRGMTSITFTLPSPSDARLEVFDLLGRHVRSVVNGRLEPGEHRATWDGRDDHGALVHPGIYLYRLTTAEHAQERKLILLRR